MHVLSCNAHFIQSSSQKRHIHVTKIYSVSKFMKTRITCYLCLSPVGIIKQACKTNLGQKGFILAYCLRLWSFIAGKLQVQVSKRTVHIEAVFRSREQCTHSYTQFIFIILILVKIHWVKSSEPTIGRISPLVKNYNTAKATDQLNLSNPS